MANGRIMSIPTAVPADLRRQGPKTTTLPPAGYAAQRNTTNRMEEQP